VTISDSTLVVKRIADVQTESITRKWLVKDLWGKEAVGIIGGAPKCCKSWLGLDIAISVASDTHCLDRFKVEHKGPALVYLAEDAAHMVKERVQGICSHRRLDIHALDLNIIDAPSLRLDLEVDRKRLTDALQRINPVLLLLDPLVRLHRADENSSADISHILGFLREIQRRFNMAVILVHHMSKKHRPQLGQALRGSGDLHAFGDCNAYLVRKDKRLLLSLEHRFAPTGDPIPLTLVSDDLGINTRLATEPSADNEHVRFPLEEALRRTLADANKPLTRTALRTILKVNNHRLGLVLKELQNRNIITKLPGGWTLVSQAQSQRVNDFEAQLHLI
jgi:hypothetical protein